ncbi:hypothetical protein QOT17_013205 [Balamuthia mandrillaris]
MASQTTGKPSTSALRLFRELMRVGYQWPTISGRESRAYRERIKQSTRNAFRKNQHLKDKQQIAAMLRFGQEELSSLQRLKANHHHDKYPLTQDTTPPQLAKRAKSLLSDKAQEKIHKGKWGFWDRLSGLWTKD